MKRIAMVCFVLITVMHYTVFSEPFAKIGSGNQTCTVTRVVRDEQVKLVGELHALKDILVDSQVGGTVTKVIVDTGDSVEKGAIIIEMEDLMLEQRVVSLQTQYDRLVYGFKDYKPFFIKQAEVNNNELFLAREKARIEVEYEKKNFQNITVLFFEGSLSEDEFDRAKMSYDLAVNSFKQAENAIRRQHVGIQAFEKQIDLVIKQVSMLQVKAPFPGEIVDVFVEVGEQVSGDSGADIARLVDISKVVFTTGVPEEYYSLVRGGNDVRIDIPGVDKALQEKVTRVSPAVDKAGRTFMIEVEIDNKNGTLKPGLFCIGFLSVKKEGLAVDSSFVTREEKGDFVILENRYHIAVKLITSPKAGEVFITGKGIKEGTVIIK